MMSSVWQAACCAPLEPVSSAWKLVPWTLKEYAPYCSELDIFVLGEAEAESRLGWLMGHWSHLNAEWNQDKLSLIYLMWKIWIF